MCNYCPFTGICNDCGEDMDGIDLNQIEMVVDRKIKQESLLRKKENIVSVRDYPKD